MHRFLYLSGFRFTKLICVTNSGWIIGPVGCCIAAGKEMLDNFARKLVKPSSCHCWSDCMKPTTWEQDGPSQKIRLLSQTKNILQSGFSMTPFFRTLHVQNLRWSTSWERHCRLPIYVKNEFS